MFLKKSYFITKIIVVAFILFFSTSLFASFQSQTFDSTETLSESNSALASERSLFLSAWVLFQGISFRENDPELNNFLKRIEQEPLEKVLSDAVLHGSGTFLTSFARSVGSTFIDPQKGNESPMGDFILNWMMLFETDESIQNNLQSSEAYFPFDGKTLLLYTWQQKFFEKWDPTFFKNSDFYKLSHDLKNVRRLPQTHLLEKNRVGIFATQQYSKILFEAGTNRRAIIHLIEDWNCRPVNSLMDFTLTDAWVGRDVDRNPGGKPEVYLQRCVGCHSGMDALRGAFAQTDFESDTLYNSARIHPKMSSNSDIFPFGHITDSTQFQNFWIHGPRNQPTPDTSKIYNGPLDLIKLLTDSEDFSSCMVKRIANQLCPQVPLSEDKIQKLAIPFDGQTKLRSLAISVGLNHCLSSGAP